MDTIWVNSADSHVLEPAELWDDRLPARLASRAPRTVRQDGYETVVVDGRSLRRDPLAFAEAIRPPGAHDLAVRLHDLDTQGIERELVFPSLGLWTTMMTDLELARASVRAYNDWLAEELLAGSDRLVGTAIVPVLSTEDAVGELCRCAALGYRAAFLPTVPPPGREYHLDLWEPLWSAAEAAGTVLCFHIGTGSDAKVTRGPGAAVINYVETLFPGQRTVAHLVASGALDRHADLRVFVAEGGASWVPTLADRMDEAYRQHGMFVSPSLSEPPSALIYRQVFTSFQHDASALPTAAATGYRNVMWGSDYPHLEGTFPRTQEVLAELVRHVDPALVDEVTRRNFERLFGSPGTAARA